MPLINTVNFGSTNQTLINTNDTWTLGTTADSRQITKLENLPIDYQIVTMVVQCTSLDNGPGFVRVYQEGQEANAAYLEIPLARMLPYVAANINLIVAESAGARNLVVDAYDPSNAAHNLASMGGKVTLYSKPYVPGV